MSSGYTQKGLQELARIVRQARGDYSYREFEAIITQSLEKRKVPGRVPHATIRRIELCDFSQGPDNDTLAKIACVLPYTAEELRRIMSGQSIMLQLGPGENIRQYERAEDVLPMVMELSDEEILRLGQMLLARLADRLNQTAITVDSGRDGTS